LKWLQTKKRGKKEHQNVGCVTDLLLHRPEPVQGREEGLCRNTGKEKRRWWGQKASHTT